MDDSEKSCLDQWLNDAKFSLVLNESTRDEAVQRVLSYYVFDSRMSQLQSIAVRTQVFVYTNRSRE